MTARIRCGWVKLREYDELLYENRFLLLLRMVVYKAM